ncbi:glycosyltransferase family 2 protein [Desulfobaculum senezii]
MTQTARELVVIPAHNEQGSVGQVVRAIREGFPDVDILVVDDASRDATDAEARAAGAGVVRLSLNLGAWGAVQTGMRYAVRHGYSHVVTMDADGQHEAQDMPLVLELLRSGGADVVIGACVERGSLLRRIAWSLFRKVSGLRIRDVTSGFRGYGPRAVKLLASPEATLLDYQDVGVLLLLQRAGCRIVERKVRMCPRVNGHSRVFGTWRVIVVYMALSLVLALTRTTYGGRVREMVSKVKGRSRS